MTITLVYILVRACYHCGGGIRYSHSCSEDNQYTDRDDEYVCGEISAVLPMDVYLYDAGYGARFNTDGEDSMTDYRKSDQNLWRVVWHGSSDDNSGSSGFKDGAALMQ